MAKSNHKGSENLRRLSPEQAREMGRKGGLASAEAKKQRKRLRHYMELLLDQPVTSTKDYNILAKMGIPPEEIDNKMLLAAALYKRATTMGDVQAVKEIRNIIGEETESANGQIDKLIQGLKDG